jgi:hypothetical protein
MRHAALRHAAQAGESHIRALLAERGDRLWPINVEMKIDQYQ